eukprot:CAMPEP_0118645066 /NCGR_PEP_ID=MMETSP0785-20121206/7294_1 /TAXON_ID=91992 /ORGANISM="Bolidomonas pacifica, Strain CCMP 1866" /LENGTH=139 /DNA_ID=CAMNT_0006536907 /DNA_START=347 /DNA_END=762 /DNA_ORIENTATION=-
MVMLSMCKSEVINGDFAGPDIDAGEECGRTALAFLFVYAMGFYFTFWGIGYGNLAKLRKVEVKGAKGVDKSKYLEPDAPTTTKFSSFLSLALVVRKAFLNHMMLAVYCGVIFSFIPGLQDLLYSNTGILRPIGDTVATV